MSLSLRLTCWLVNISACLNPAVSLYVLGIYRSTLFGYCSAVINIGFNSVYYLVYDLTVMDLAII